MWLAWFLSLRKWLVNREKLSNFSCYRPWLLCIVASIVYCQLTEIMGVQWRSPGRGNGNPLQYSCLKNSRDRGVWQVESTARVRHDLVTEQQEQNWDHVVLAKRFIQVFPNDLTERPEQTFWPTQYNGNSQLTMTSQFTGRWSVNFNRSGG